MSNLPSSSDTKGSNYRLVDYVFQVGLKSDTNLLERILPVTTTDQGSQADLSVVAVDHSSENKTILSMKDVTSKGGHPINYHYQAETIHRYPEADDEESQKFPTYVPMFCFPNDLKLMFDDSNPPPETYHSFVITEDMGTKCYGVCVTIYEKPSSSILSQLDEFVTSWRSSHIQETDFEYAKHVQGQLAFYKERLLKAKAGILEDEDQKEAISTAEEKIILYEELLKPLKESLFFNTEYIYQPRCIGLLSHWPLYNFMKDWLCCVVHGLRLQTIPSLESAVLNLIHEIPLPPPGKLELALTVGNKTLFCARPPVNTISHLRNFSFHPLFRSLSLSHIVVLFESAMLERKIIFMSSHTSMLAPACEALSQFLFPFYWHHILIPVLPSRLLSYLQAPVPYIVGVNKKYFGEAVQNEWMPSDAILVDLDKDAILGPPPPVLLPHRERKKLLARLEKHVGPIGRQPLAIKHIPPDESLLLKGVPLHMKYAFPENYLLTHVHESYIGYRKVHDILKSTYSQYANEFLHMKQPGRKARTLLNNASSQSFEVLTARSAVTTPRMFGAPRSQRTSPIRAPPPISSSSLTYGPSIGSVDMSSFVSLADQSTPNQQPQANVSPSKPTASPLRNSITTESQPIVVTSPTSDDENEDHFLEALGRKVDESFASPTTTDIPSIVRSDSDRQSFETDVHNSHTAHPQADTQSIASTATTTKKSWWKTGRKDTSEPSSALQSPVNTLSFFSNGTKNANKRATILGLGSFTSLTQPNGEEENKQGYFNKFLGSATNADSSSLSLGQIGDPEDDASSPPKDPEKIYHREGHVFHQLIPVVKLDHIVDIGGSETGSGTHTPRTVEDEEGVDQFGLDSQSSDDYTRSEASTILDARAAVHRIPSPRTALPIPEAKERRRSTTGNPGQSGQRKMDQFFICYFCRENLKREESTISMCELCHIKVHTDCLHLAEAYPCGVVFHDDKIRASFLKVFTSLLKNYRAHLKTSAPSIRYMGWQLKSPMAPKPPTLAPQQSEDSTAESDEFFRRQDFFAELDSETRTFMTHFTETQGFAQFILDRIEKPENDYEILYFDESIKAKLNRSKLRFTKETTPFLKETSYAITTTIHALPPYEEDLSTPALNTTINGSSIFDWNVDRVFAPRQVQPLLTEQDYKMMRSHTNELIQRARSALRQKQDFSKWMKTKMKQFQKGGNGELVALGTLPDDERKELLEDRLSQVNQVIDQYEAIHISSQTGSQIAAALQVLHEQNLVLVKAADEEQLVDSDEQEEVQLVLARLIRVITIYEDYQTSLKNSNAHHLAERQESLDIDANGFDRNASIIGIAPADTKDCTPQPSSSDLASEPPMSHLVEAAEKRIFDKLFSSKTDTSVPSVQEDRVAKWAADVKPEHSNSIPELPPPPVALENGKFMSSTFLKFDDMISPSLKESIASFSAIKESMTPIAPSVGNSPSRDAGQGDDRKESYLRS